MYAAMRAAKQAALQWVWRARRVGATSSTAGPMIAHHPGAIAGTSTGTSTGTIAGAPRFDADFAADVEADVEARSRLRSKPTSRSTIGDDC